MIHNHFQKLSVLIPAYNEQETIIELLNKVKRVNIPLEKEIIVIDNFSGIGVRRVNTRQDLHQR